MTTEATFVSVSAAEEALQEALAALTQLEAGENREVEKVSRALRMELRRASNPTAWPVLSTEERTELIDGGLSGGRYPEPAEMDESLTRLNERRGPLWQALLGVSATLLDSLSAAVPQVVEEYRLEEDAFGRRRVLNCTRSVGRRVLTQPPPGVRMPAEAIRQQAIDGNLWFWCNEGWDTSRYDLYLAEGEPIDAVLGARQSSGPGTRPRLTRSIAVPKLGDVVQLHPRLRIVMPDADGRHCLVRGRSEFGTVVNVGTQSPRYEVLWRGLRLWLDARDLEVLSSAERS